MPWAEVREMYRPQGARAPEQRVVEEGRIWAALSYIPFVSVLVVLSRRQNPFVVFHAKQALVVLVGLCVAGFVPVVGHWVLEPLLYLASLVGFVEALMGNYFTIPLVADVARRLNL